VAVAGPHATAAHLQGDVAAADDSCKQTVAAFPDSRASHKQLHEPQAQPKRFARFSESIRSIKVFGSRSHHPSFPEDAGADAVSPFEMHGAAYGDLLQVHQCSISE
jgi:hypothetical protein